MLLDSQRPCAHPVVEHRDDLGDVESLRLADGRQVAGDLFIDCSGFRSLLLGETLEEKYVGYDTTLFCDAAIVGSWERDDEVRPYTTAETMGGIY